MRCCLVLAVLGACGMVAEGASAAKLRVGPITATATLSDRSYVCRQAGIFARSAGEERLLAALDWRPFALAAGTAGDAAREALLVGGGQPARHGSVALLALDGGVLAEARIADDLVYAVAIAPGGAFAIAGCADGRLVRLSMPTLADTAMSWRHDAPVAAVAFSVGGTRLASVGHDGRILIGDHDADAPFAAVVDHTAAVLCVAWSDRDLLASGARDGKVRLHDGNGRLLLVWQRLGGPVTAVAFRDGRLEYSVAGHIGVAGHTGTLHLP